MTERAGPDSNEFAGRESDRGPGSVARSRVRPFLARHGPVADHRDHEVGGLRPFVLTSGRVSAEGRHIGLETQVAARAPDDLATATLPPEKRAIVGLCAEPLSVAEISARLRLHFGVVRILVGDLAAEGFLDVRSEDVVDPHDPDLILRVIRGLRSLT
jgi:hypothetical protein